jgi:prophage tail gpP-like protein
MSVTYDAVPRQPEAVASFVIGGVNYNEILKLRVHRDMNEATGEGEVTLSWPGASTIKALIVENQMLSPAFMDGAAGTILLDGQLAMSFVFDTRTSHGSPTQYELELHFRGRAAAIVDGPPKHETGQENDKTIPQIVKKLMEGYDAAFVDKSGSTRKIKRFIIAQGETTERAMRRATREFSHNFFENEEGQIVLWNKDDNEGTGGQLVLGDRKITHWSVKRDIAPRFTEGEVLANAIPTDEKYGKAAEMLSSSVMASAGAFMRRRTYLADGDHDWSTIKDRGGFEFTRSSSQGLNVTLRVSTWTDVNGELWKLNKLYPVTIPVDGVNETLMLSAVTFVLTPTERYATLVLTSANSYGKLGDVLSKGPNSMTEIYKLQTGPRKTPEEEKKEEEEAETPPPPGRGR